MQGVPAERRYVPHLLGVLGVLLTADALGTAFSPMLAVRAPLLLIALSPLGRHLVLVAPETSFVPFTLIASARRLLAFGAIYFLARAYGEDGFRWIEARYARLGRAARWFERAFQKAAPAVVLLLPGIAAPVAGATRMPARTFFALATPAVVVWVGVAYAIGDALSEWTAPVLTFIREHIASTTAACVVAVLLYQWRRRTRARARSAAPDAAPPA